MYESQRKHSWNEARHSSTFRNVTNSFLNTWENVVNCATHTSLFAISHCTSYFLHFYSSPNLFLSLSQIAGQIFFHLLVTVAAVEPKVPKVPMERAMAEKQGFLHGFVYFPRRIDSWHFKGIINIPLMNLEAIILASSLESGVETVLRGGECTKIKLPKSKYLYTAQAQVNDTWVNMCINIF